jgi:hypothetical protein
MIRTPMAPVAHLRVGGFEELLHRIFGRIHQLLREVGDVAELDELAAEGFLEVFCGFFVVAAVGGADGAGAPCACSTRIPFQRHYGIFELIFETYIQ